MKTNYPIETEWVMYLEDNNDLSLAEILAQVKDKWPDAELENIQINAEHRHVTCLGYDLYDSTDYQNYIVVTLNEK